MFGRSSKGEVVAGVTECGRLGEMKSLCLMRLGGRKEGGREGGKEGRKERGRKEGKFTEKEMGKGGEDGGEGQIFQFVSRFKDLTLTNSSGRS